MIEILQSKHAGPAHPISTQKDWDLKNLVSCTTVELSCCLYKFAVCQGALQKMSTITVEDFLVLKVFYDVVSSRCDKVLFTTWRIEWFPTKCCPKHHTASLSFLFTQWLLMSLLLQDNVSCYPFYSGESKTLN